ncbi:YheC/YheD family protein [Bacillus aquiflavi]|uniref:YheC/YheD family protein n=1 Tax=Bacillus aquiflavi TaxID=2672567 RepID=A0A6B3VPZ2_9BACI|nr:YheC/YheD family protein [Bacillus aquiflavi]NEY80019.1 hypothetical protein [Bacillus aquiflavi]UAC49948.1 YheC/YheD family protein [Bacillus aquiflavi]
MGKNHLGPLIGILTNRKKNGFIKGNIPLFKALQLSLTKKKAASFVFTPDGINADHIIGFIYIPKHKKWQTVTAPFPDLVYNRIPSRAFEKTRQFEQTIRTFKNKGIPLFNPCFIDKYECYTLLKQHSILKSYLPETILIDTAKQLNIFLQKHVRLYLKPACSGKGKGIYRLTMPDNKKILLEKIGHQHHFPDFSAFWSEMKDQLLKKKYIAQEEIKTKTIEGHRFDLRLLVHANLNQYDITGIGIRQSQKQELTTHIPNGGRLLPYNIIQNQKHDQNLTMLAKRCGECLSKELGFFGEFSIDVGITNDDQYVIYEINSKPMSFDELEIEEKRVEKLCQLFFQMTNFPLK